MSPAQKPPARVSAVTALYDIKRHAVDGRSIADYVGWLNKTLQLPIHFTLFLDPAIDPATVRAKSTDMIIQSPLEESEFFEFREHILAVAETKKRFLRRKKLVYRMPLYGLVIFSKFSYLRRAAQLRPDDDGLLWVDAGASRFIADAPPADALNLPFLADALKEGPLGVSITKTLERDLAAGRRRRNYVGTSERLVTGTSFLVRRAEAAGIAHAVHAYLKDRWVPEFLWDNEEVGLGEMMLDGALPAHPLYVSKRYDDLLRAAFVFPQKEDHA